MTRFVNPYTFVPHARLPERGKPNGHAKMLQEHLSGVLNVTLTARTPLLIGGFSDNGKPDVPRRSGDRRAIVPGSGLLGAVRSLHEALAGGCLRVLDTERVPVHRHPANISETRDLRLAVVSDVDGGRATEVRLCDNWVWIPERLLPRGEDWLPRTGDQIQYRPRGDKETPLPEGVITGPSTRRVMHAESETFPDGIEREALARVGTMGEVTQDCWVVLVTDTNARQLERRVHFAAGRIGRDAPSCGITESAWKTYLDVVAGADDLRPESLKKAGAPGREEPAWDPGKPSYDTVWWPPQETPGADRKMIGERLLARTYLYRGQPVWVRVRGGEVIEIRLSQLWRYPGDGPVGERVGDAKPCTDPENLCWSCRLFGSADTEGRDEDDLAVQHSYRGHVRIDDLVADGDVEPVTWHLAPLASPKPSAGQFYLEQTAGRKRLADKDTRAAATWGSVADEPKPRPIRGRKFYWRTTDPASGSFPRGKHRPHQSDAMGSEVALVPAGTVFRGRVCFDNLSVADYGSLLAALDPRLLAAAEEDARGADWEGVVTSVGGGKPFGFGAVAIEIGPALAQTAGERYLGADVQGPGKTEAVRDFRSSVPHGVWSTWPALQHALTFGFVSDDKVWYPPGGGEKGSEDYDKSFEFFARTNGLQLKNETRELVVLPDAVATAVAQVLESRPDTRRRGGRG